MYIPFPLKLHPYLSESGGELGTTFSSVVSVTPNHELIPKKGACPSIKVRGVRIHSYIFAYGSSELALNSSEEGKYSANEGEGEERQGECD